MRYPCVLGNVVDEKFRKDGIMSKKWKGPDLDKYLENRNKRLVTYVQGAQIYSMNYYTFVRLAREAGANIRSRKVVVGRTRTCIYFGN